jgi:hypothetical protein
VLGPGEADEHERVPAARSCAALTMLVVQWTQAADPDAPWQALFEHGRDPLVLVGFTRPEH